MSDDPKQIWQNQRTGSQAIQLDRIQRKAADLGVHTRKELHQRIAVLLLVVVLSGIGVLLATGPLQRAGFAIAMVWAAAAQYFLNRGMRQPVPPAGSALITGIEYYRSEIERRRHLFRRALGWLLGPVVLAVATFVVPLVRLAISKHLLIPNMIPFLALLAAWMVIVVVQRIRDQRSLEREIDDLRQVEQESGR